MYKLGQSVRDCLQKIESKEIKITCNVVPQSIGKGEVEYETSNGWRLIVFNCKGSFWSLDYVFVPIRGNIIEVSDEVLDDIAYMPSDNICWDIFGLPGYEKSRCIRCSALIDHPKNNIYLCEGCTDI